MKKIISQNPLTGSTTWWSEDRETGESLVQTVQNVDTLLDWNKKLANEAGKTFDKQHPLGTKVASIPMTLYGEWLRDGRDRDEAFVKRWLNDSSNLFFRTHEAKL